MERAHSHQLQQRRAVLCPGGSPWDALHSFPRAEREAAVMQISVHQQLDFSFLLLPSFFFFFFVKSI